MNAAVLVSASRRTDLPAFHSRWLLGRLRAGFCHWVHPYTGRVARVALDPGSVLGLVLWTRNPRPLLPHVESLRAVGHSMVFQFTINGYGPPIESHNPDVERQVEGAARLARTLGPEAVLWRYDPILLADDLGPDVHARRFEILASRLAGITRRCTISFVDLYGKTTRNLARVESERGRVFERPDLETKRTLAARLARIANRHGMALLSCCDDALLGDGVGKSRCVDPVAIESVRGRALPAVASRPTRKDCGCVASVDIGTYDTCAFGCSYCYAVTRRETAIKRLSECDPDDTILWRPPSLRGVNLDSRCVHPLEEPAIPA
jgi:hypothetical protein